MGRIRIAVASLGVLAGLVGLGYGLWLVWPPLTWIIGSLALVTVAGVELLPPKVDR